MGDKKEDKGLLLLCGVCVIGGISWGSEFGGLLALVGLCVAFYHSNYTLIDRRLKFFKG